MIERWPSICKALGLIFSMKKTKQQSLPLLENDSDVPSIFIDFKSRAQSQPSLSTYPPSSWQLAVHPASCSHHCSFKSSCQRPGLPGHLSHGGGQPASSPVFTTHFIGPNTNPFCVIFFTKQHII